MDDFWMQWTCYERVVRALCSNVGVQTMDTMCLGEIARAKGSDPVKVIERVRKGIADVADRGIEHEVSLIFGLPHQSVTSFCRDIEIISELSPAAKINAFPLMLLRGTPLFDARNRLELIEKAGIEHEIVASIQKLYVAIFLRTNPRFKWIH